MKMASEKKLLDWHLGDIEQRFGFNGGKYTDVNTWFALLATALITGAFFIGLCHVPSSIRSLKAITMILERGWTPYAMVSLFVLALMILFIKWRKLAFQKKAFEVELIPVGNNFALTSETALDVIKTLNESVDDPKRFVLFNRIERALLNPLRYYLGHTDPRVHWNCCRPFWCHRWLWSRTEYRCVGVFPPGQSCSSYEQSWRCI